MDKMRLYISEAIGTFFLVGIGVGAISASKSAGGSVSLLAVAVAFGMTVAVMVAATGHVSGAHINPAVTFSLLIARRISLLDAAGYLAAQLVGAVLAALALDALIGRGVSAAGATVLAASVTPLQGVLIEAILTFLLVFVIFGTAVDVRGQKAPALFIGLAVSVDILMGGPYTGASMNPARSFGPALIGGEWDAHWVFWIGPLLGAAAAGVTYTLVFLPRSPAEERSEVRPEAAAEKSR